MYKRVLIAFDGSDSARNVLEQALIFARSENASVDIVTVVPGYAGDLRLLGNTHVLEELNAQYRCALDDAVDVALARNVRARGHLRTGEPDEEILRAAEELKADLIVMGKRTQPVLAPLPIGSVVDDVTKHSEVDILIISSEEPLGLERIFLAYDGSAGANIAARQACALAARYGAHLNIGITYEMDLEAFSLAPELEDALRDKAEKKLEKALQMAREADVQHYGALIRHGNPSYQTLVNEAQTRHTGLLVAGACGRSNLSEVLIGGVVRRIVALSDVPVLIVKQ